MIKLFLQPKRFQHFLLSLTLYLLLYTIFLPTCHSKSRHKKKKPSNHNTISDNQKQTATDPRIAILIPYIGQDLPSYFPLFAQTAAGSSSLVDFFIFHNGIPETNLPSPDQLQQHPNVKLINLQNTQRLANFLLRVVEHRQDILEVPYNQLLQWLTQHLSQYPYVLVEFKMAMGMIFQNFISDYTHWGYSDLDIAMGDLSRWITKEELEDFDLVTYGYGDQHRLYIRGQFTFMKNSDKMNEIWKGCTYLSKLDARLAKVIEGIEKLSFESAEGCFSKMILEQTDIKVKYAVKAFTDILETDSVHTLGLYIGKGSNGDRSVLYKADSSKMDGQGLSSLPIDWFEHDTTYVDINAPLQWEVGEQIPVQTYSDVDSSKESKCMYWVKSKYQSDLCAMDVEPDDTVFYIDGVLLKQKHVTYSFPQNIQSLPLFHFQEWKRYYRRNQIRPIMHSLEMGVKGLIVTSDGIVPMLATLEDHDLDHGRVPKQVDRWEQTTFVQDELELPTSTFCIRSSQRQFPPNPIASDCIELGSWQDEEFVEILSSGETWDYIDTKKDVTLILTLELNPTNSHEPHLDGLLQLAEQNINIWGNEQPSILLIHVAGTTQLVANTVYEKLEMLIEKGKDNTPHEHVDLDTEEADEEDEEDASLNIFSSCLVAVMFNIEIGVISRKALLNMASAAAPTRYVVSGLEVERGILLSKETALFAKRAVLSYGDTKGNVFIIPQFASKVDLIDQEEALETIGVEEFLSETSNLKLSTMRELDCHSCKDMQSDDYYMQSKEDQEVEIGLENQINSLWRELSGFDLSIKGGKKLREEERYSMEKYQKLQIDLINLLQPKNERVLRNYDINPLLMIDSIGPYDGTITSTIASEVEELGGLRCFNALRLAKFAILGYNIQILPGAFSISFPASRIAANGGDCSQTDDSIGVGLSRCDGCFMFENKDLIESIIMNERKLSAKMSILWNELLVKDAK